jgi:DNA-binding NarL/FixJ family response regulator
MERAEHVLVLTADARFARALDALLLGSGFGPTSRVATVAELLARRDVDAQWAFVAIDVKDVPDAAGVIARTRDAFTRSRILVFSGALAVEAVSDFWMAGADGLLSVTSSTEGLARALRTVASGLKVVSEELLPKEGKAVVYLGSQERYQDKRSLN